MTQRTLVSLLFFGLLVFAGVSADASTLRCKNGIVSYGDSFYEVATTCGNPDWRQQYVEYQTVQKRVPTVCGTSDRQRVCYVLVEQTVPLTVDEWTYDFGRNRFVELVRFEQGRLVAVSTLGYSKKN